MTQLERLLKLNEYLLEEEPRYKKQASGFSKDEDSQFQLFRSLVNIRMPGPASQEFLDLQDEYLQMAIKDKGITSIDELTPLADDLYLWRGDITTVSVDAIVNAANSEMLGCFCPCHKCIDNAIHTYAGVQLRKECAEIMMAEGKKEATGQAKITRAYNLPSKYVIHTVGPIVTGQLTEFACEQLSSCYRSCLSVADNYELSSIAFCCISTGEFHFPNDIAAKVAIQTVNEYKSQSKSKIKVIFNVFKESDYNIYWKLLGGSK